MKRQSLSASLGSWCFQLIYNPRQPSHAENPRANSRQSPTSPPRSALLLLLLPAFAALLLGTGAGCYALAYFLTLGPLTNYLLSLLLVCGLVSLGAHCGSPRAQRLCVWMRWMLLILIFVLVVSTRSSSFLPDEGDTESNAIVAMLLCLVTIISVLLVGVQSGGRAVPLSAPLVPCLSLFGLLCLISVNTIVQICFVVFVGAALYLLSYDRFLRFRAPELATGIALAPVSSTQPLLPSPSRRECWRWAKESLLVSGVWLALFMVGGTLFYLPVQWALPRLISSPLSRVKAAAQGATLDYTGSAPMMELRGGNHSLSERSVMRITLRQGRTSGLWRGRVYEIYSRSQWEEKTPEINNLYLAARRNARFSPFNSSFRPINAVPLPHVAAHVGRVEQAWEFVEPLQGGQFITYASGPVLSSSQRNDMTLDDASTAYDAASLKSPYLVHSYFIQPQINHLYSLAGYDPHRATTLGISPATKKELQANLQNPADASTSRTLSAISQQILLGQTDRILTPYEKVRAINLYLSQNCFYSLHSPIVPPTQDAVVYFLTGSHEGACDMFASSMALLLRQMDVPARVVSGYLQPENPDPISVDTPHRPAWTVRERDAHAWVEYYVPHLGWITYDPTASARPVETLPSQIVALLDLPRVSVPPALIILPTLGLLMLIGGVLWPRVEKQLPRLQSLDEDTRLRLQIVQNYRAAQRLMRRRVPAVSHWTPHEYEARVSRAPISSAAKQEFAALTHLYIAARYGEVPHLSSDELRGCLQRFRQGLRVKSKAH